MRTAGSPLEPASGQAESSTFFEIRVANRAAPVRIEYSAIRELRLHLRSGSECVGLLLGASSREALTIQRCELLTLSAATLGDSKSLQGAFRQFIKARSQNPVDMAPELVGCFRSQTAGWPGMKDGDVDIVKQNFAGPNQLFLSIRTPQHRPWLAALYALDAKNAAASREPVSEFPFDEYLLRNGYLTDLMETTETDDFPEQPSRSWRSGSRWILTALLSVVLLGGSAAYKFRSKWYRPIGRIAVTGANTSSLGPLSLKVARSEKDFDVSWDRLSPAVQQSSSGKLTISDGALTRTVDLTGSQLREGHILYTPLFEELTFRLEVATPDQGASAESVQVLAWSGKQPPALTAVAPPQPSANGSTPHAGNIVAAGNVAKPPAGVPAIKPPAPPTAASRTIATQVVASPSTAKSLAKSTPVAPAAASNTTSSPASNTASNLPQPPPAQQAQPPKSSSSMETARVNPPSSPSSERTPASQITPQVPAGAPSARPPAAAQPTPEPQPLRQSTVPAASASPSQVSSPRATPAPSLPPSSLPSGAASSVVAGGVATPPVPIQRLTPALPRNIAAAGSQNVTSISVRAMVDSAGSVQSVQVISSTPKRFFGEAVIQKAALDAAKKWKFRPGQLNGKNVAAEYTIDFKFQ